jgi:hypothetical protein
VTINAYGFWSLARLGYGDIVLKQDPRTAKAQVAIPFRLPKGAYQGRGHWYLIHLHFRVRVRADSLPGEFNVAADTDQRTCASVIFTVAKSGGHRIVTSDALGLVNGIERQRSRELVRDLRFENFLVTHGVHPGLNVLTFDLTSNAIPMVQEARIFADSGIEFARAGPPAVEVNASIREHSVHVGARFHVDVSLTRTSGIPLPRVAIRIRTGSDAVRGATTRSVVWGAGRTLRTSFTLEALRAGRVPMTVFASTNGFPSKGLVLYIDPK